VRSISFYIFYVFAWPVFAILLKIILSNFVKKYSPIAQSVEQVAVNHPVDGSSPSRGANKINGLEKMHSKPFFYTQQYTQHRGKILCW
jgi:hypothetical protein